MAKIGIDFGTTISKVSYVDANGEARAITFRRTVGIPTLLYYDERELDRPKVGEEAFNRYKFADKNPDIINWIAKDLKRNLSDNGYPTQSPDITYVDAVSDFLRYIKEYVERQVFSQEEITDVCITYPVMFDMNKKDLLRTAAEKAGFSNVVMLKEPEAAAMGYVNYLQKRENFVFRDSNVLIFDFGGGTLDLSLVEMKFQGDFLLSVPPCGDANCGGENIDREIYNAWDKYCLEEYGHQVSNEAGNIDFKLLKVDCKGNKETLSEHFNDDTVDTPCLVDAIGGGEMLEMNVSREQWEVFLARTLEKARRQVREMKRRAEEKGIRIDSVVLIGGSSYIYQVKKMLREELGIEPSYIEAQDVAVANGAALYIENGIMPIRCFCMYCGHEMNSSIKYCPQCGKPNASYDIRCE